MAKRVKIFLSSSKNLGFDRQAFELDIYRKTKRFEKNKGIFLELVNYEDFNHAIVEGGKQAEYNDAIRKCDIFVMLYSTKVGMYTYEEFETALDNFKTQHKPFIYTYYKDDPAVDPLEISLKHFRKKLKNIKHYEKVYEGTFELLHHFSDQLDMLLPEIEDKLEDKPGQKEIIPSIAIIDENPECTVYDLLCGLDFKLQVEHFECLYNYRKIVPFLLHGESDSAGNDLKWLCNQILHKTGLNKERPIIIDLDSADMLSPWDTIRKDLCRSLEVDENMLMERDDDEPGLMDALRQKIEKRLEKHYLVCIIQSPESLLNSEEDMDDLFTGFLRFMNRHIVRDKTKHSLILLFVDKKLAQYTHKKGEYIHWYPQNNCDEYAILAEKNKGVKIIDLAPVRKLTSNDVREWIKWSMKCYKCYKEYNISNLYEKEDEVLKTGDRPFAVITSICNHFKIEMQSSWIS